MIDMPYRKRKQVFVLDSNLLMMKSAAVFRNLSLESGEESGIVYGYVSKVLNIIWQDMPDYFVPLFDNGRSKYRTNIRAEYKGNRGKKSDSKIKQFEACKEFASLLGFNPYCLANTEADDLAAAIVSKYASKYYIKLWSADHDWRQLLRDNVVLIKELKGNIELITEKKATEELGLDIHRWPEIAAIVGDPGDGVYGLKGFGYGKAKKMLYKYGDLWNAVANDDKLKPYSKTILENYQLTILDGSIAEEQVSIEAHDIRNIKDIDREALYAFFDRWQLNKAKKDFENEFV